MIKHIYALKSGKIKAGLYTALGRSGNDFVSLKHTDLIELPSGSDLFLIPNAVSILKDKEERLISLEKLFGEKIFPVAAVTPPGYIRLFLPAYQKLNSKFILPLFDYTAAAFKGNKILSACLNIDNDYRWQSSQFNTYNLKYIIERKIKKYPLNRILKHLSSCALNLNCYTAQNIFYSRWEGGIPTTCICNANCLGCISLQDRTPSPQGRINFTPSVEEIAEVGLTHLASDNSMISFGQGCEGEPSLNSKLISKAIEKIRGITDKGGINMNTNALNPPAIGELADAGLNSIRISLNSVIDEHYKKYFRLKETGLKQVKESIGIAKDRGLKVFLNLLVLPGITDDQFELEELLKFINHTLPDKLLLRNLNIDPDYYYQEVKAPTKNSIGIKNWLEFIRKNINIDIGSFNQI